MPAARRWTPREVANHPDSEALIRGVEESLPPLVRPARLAEALDISRQRLYEMIRMGEFAAVRVGKRGLRVYRDSVVNWLRRGGQ